MQGYGWRRYMLEVAENAIGSKEFEYLAIKAPLALVRQMMNCEAGDYAIEASHFGQRICEIVGDDSYIGS